MKENNNYEMKNVDDEIKVDILRLSRNYKIKNVNDEIKDKDKIYR